MEPAPPLPAYYRLKRRLLADIEAGHYGTAGRLPTEHELCAAYGLSRLVAFLENDLGHRVQDEELTAENFATLWRLGQSIATKVPIGRRGQPKDVRNEQGGEA